MGIRHFMIKRNRFVQVCLFLEECTHIILRNLNKWRVHNWEFMIFLICCILNLHHWVRFVLLGMHLLNLLNFQFFVRCVFVVESIKANRKRSNERIRLIGEDWRYFASLFVCARVNQRAVITLSFAIPVKWRFYSRWIHSRYWLIQLVHALLLRIQTKCLSLQTASCFLLCLLLLLARDIRYQLRLSIRLWRRFILLNQYILLL